MAVRFIDVVVDALIHGLDPSGDEHLPLKSAGVVDADQRLQLFDETAGFILRDEPGGLHRIHQQLSAPAVQTPVTPAGSGTPAPPSSCRCPVRTSQPMSAYRAPGPPARRKPPDAPSSPPRRPCASSVSPVKDLRQIEELPLLIPALGHVPRLLFSPVYHIFLI